MIRPRLLLLALLLVGPLGCTPDGPREFYRDALQARSEFVDGLIKIVDEPSAKEYYPLIEKRFSTRTQTIRDNLDTFKTKMNFDNSFRRLRQENFTLKRLDTDIVEGMIDGMKAYTFYCENVRFTNARLGRELSRLRLVQEASVAKKIDEQLSSNVPTIDVNASRDFPTLKKVLDKVVGKDMPVMAFLPGGVTKAEIDKLESGLDVTRILGFNPDRLDIKLDDFELPPPPQRPAWIDDVYKRMDNRNGNLPAMPAGTFSGEFQGRAKDQGGGQPAAAPANLVLTNNSGKELKSVNGTLSWNLPGLGGGREMLRFNFDTWPAGEKQTIPCPVAEGLTQVRWAGIIQVGGAPTRFDMMIPNQPPPAKN